MKKNNNMFIITVLCLATVVLCLLITLVASGNFNNKREDMIFISDMSWKYEIQISRLEEFEESGWDLPDGAELIRRNYEHKYTTIMRVGGANIPRPIYAYKYYYKIKRYVYSRSVITEDNSKEPYWGNLNLLNDEIETERTEEYFIHSIDKNGNTIKYSIDVNDWKYLSVGDSIRCKINKRKNTVSLIK